MDNFVRDRLTEWNLSNFIDTFQEQEIDEESFYCLDEKEIENLIPKAGPRTRFKERLRLLKKQNINNPDTGDSSAQYQQKHEEAAFSAQDCPSTSGTSDRGKRRLDVQNESGKRQSTSMKRRCDFSDQIIHSRVKDIMRVVHDKLPNQDNNLIKFLKKKIGDLETDKRELIGVFGRTGAGKSSLINAVIGEKNLLPSGSIKACTSVMIKVEANMLNQKYEAEIEFIAKEEWKDEIWSFINFLRDNEDEQNDLEDDDEYRDTVERLCALYGEEWNNIPRENLMDNKYFKEIPEFLNSKTKLLTCESAKELSAKSVKYTRSDSRDRDTKGVTRWYWPLVKCVTVRVPNNELLQHVTLVDLPGNGDRNKSRDKMWREVVGRCSTVWIVTDINRAAAEKEPWEILESACSLIGNGGECRQINFICTKSDLIEDADDHSADGGRGFIFKRNMQAKDQVHKEFRKLSKVKKHFSDECFKVFTVSSKEFLKPKSLQQEETEIPELQASLQDLNARHSETLNYVSGAHGILSLIQGARCRDVTDITNVCRDLDEKLSQELDKARKQMQETYDAFEKCLNEGVENSKYSCDKLLQPVLRPRTNARGFHQTLKCLVRNGGIHKTKKGKQVNLNMNLASCLTDSIDEEFKKTFPNSGNSGPFKGVISSFSLGTETMMREGKYKDVELQLIFLKTEEEKLKSKLTKSIRERKKTVYSSLTTTIEENMQECYRKAADIRGKDSQQKMRSTIETHVFESKNIMFQRAKNNMLGKLEELMEEILQEMKKTMQESIELSLKADDNSLPDVLEHFKVVKNYNNELEGSPNEEPSPTDVDAPGPAAAESMMCA